MFHDFVNLLYPPVCHICEAELLKNERIICTACLHDLPVTRYHFDNENPVKKVFYGRAKVENATALLHFRKKAGVQQLIHELKYRGKKEIGNFLGEWLGSEISKISEYRKIDLVIPVPLHKSRLKKRGYNQVEGFGKEIALAIKAEYADDILLKITASETQTLKNRIARGGKINESLSLQNIKKAENKNLLIVDDLVTTGATLEACALKLQEIPGVKISIATMAITD
ncbi:amidophosphoribosyltransferase [Christiangramia fulva]|uniref:Amidophosphoribosyltransferase n=1 Tax=Christiangramia fulva TaxID=2126553 RepID=A0A2R3Z2R8_9FLAO|nr:double zinc ribbon domain-containing protein [Christiangramia fulva]AVR44546.1 amidophosphoribosyltransferase [Christiangramia fulva]